MGVVDYMKDLIKYNFVVLCVLGFVSGPLGAVRFGVCGRRVEPTNEMIKRLDAEIEELEKASGAARFMTYSAARDAQLELLHTKRLAEVARLQGQARRYSVYLVSMQLQEVEVARLEEQEAVERSERAAIDCKFNARRTPTPVRAPGITSPLSSVGISSASSVFALRDSTAPVPFSLGSAV